MISTMILDWISLLPTLGDNTVSVLLQLNRGALRKTITYASGGASRLRCVALADMNNDTQLDIVVANYGTDNIGILLGYGNGTFRNQLLIDTGSNSHPQAIAIGDFNGDNHLDIAVANYATKTIDMLLQNRIGTFVNQINHRNNSVLLASVIITADFNNDRRSEIRLYKNYIIQCMSRSV